MKLRLHSSISIHPKKAEGQKKNKITEKTHKKTREKTNKKKYPHLRQMLYNSPFDDTPLVHTSASSHRSVSSPVKTDARASAKGGRMLHRAWAAQAPLVGV